MKENRIWVVLKGMAVGGTMLVPGVSGGTMAMLLGIYDKLITSVSSFGKRKMESLLFLLLFSAGGGLGIFLLASPVLQLLERYPLPMQYFFMGTVAGGIPLIFRQSRVSRATWDIPLYIGLGMAVVFLIGALPEDLFGAVEAGGGAGMLLLAVTGAVLAAGLILPGISVSYLLLVLGLYDRTMEAVSSLNLVFLLPLGLGAAAGILCMTKGLDHAMNRYPQPTYLIILGFIFGSLGEIFPGVPEAFEIAVCALTAAAGFVIMRTLSALEA